MKTKTLIAAIGMAVLLAINLNAQTSQTPSGGGSGGGGKIGCDPSVLVPERLPISMDDLQAMAWKSVAQIGVYGQTSSTVRASTNDQSQVWLPYSPAAGVVDVEEIFSLVRAQRLQWSVVNLEDYIGLGSGLYDRDGNNLLYANNSGKINPPENSVSKNALDLVYNMNDNVWLAFTNAVGYRIVERDQDGNPVLYYYARGYDVQPGRIRFYQYFSGKGGEIIVQLCDGTEVAYGLNNGGQRIVPTTVILNIGEVSALGMRTFRDTNTVYVQVLPEEFQRNINPLSQLVVNGEKSEWINFSAWYIDPQQQGGKEVFASAVSFWPQGSPSSVAKQLKIAESVPYVPVYLPPGRYWVKFAFKGWPDGNQFYPPYQGPY